MVFGKCSSYVILAYFYRKCIQNDHKHVVHGMAFFDFWKTSMLFKKDSFVKCAYLFSAWFWSRAQQPKCRGLIFKQITKMWMNHRLVVVHLGFQPRTSQSADERATTWPTRPVVKGEANYAWALKSVRKMNLFR